MKSRLLETVCAYSIAFVSLSANAVGVSGQGTWETTLQGRDLDGNAATFEAYYDTTLDITWLANGNANGVMLWDTAIAWSTTLDVNGVTGWRLPTMMDTGTPGCNYATVGTDCGWNVQTGTAATTVYSEMASLFFDTLGNLSFQDINGIDPQTGWGLTNTGPFHNLQSGFYWTGLENAPYPDNAWLFDFKYGYQSSNYKTDSSSNFYGLAVHEGDVGAVPVPAAVWLFSTGLIGLLGIAHRKRT